MRETIGWPGARSWALRAAEAASVAGGGSSKWRTRFICAAVSPRAPAHVIVRAIDTLAGDTTTLPGFRARGAYSSTPKVLLLRAKRPASFMPASRGPAAGDAARTTHTMPKRRSMAVSTTPWGRTNLKRSGPPGGLLSQRPVVTTERLILERPLAVQESPKAARTGEERLEEAVREHARLVYRVAYAVLRNAHDAEDASQEAFIRVLR